MLEKYKKTDVPHTILSGIVVHPFFFLFDVFYWFDRIKGRIR